jgi:outer membrane receptor protein involved in Fe transport
MRHLGWRACVALTVLSGGWANAQSTPADAPTTTVVVTATRLPRPLEDVPATVIVLPQAEIERNPSLTMDDVLRSIPSVEMFRRTPSLVADPSSQGLNLRGLGPSGVSRALVLVDGLPVNDPFGGWVYWRSLPRLGLDRAEVVMGGASALYGSSALGGVVELWTRPLDEREIDANVEVGSLLTEHVAARVADRWGPVGAALEADALTSEGYIPVVPAARGAIDIPAGSADVATNGRVDWELGPRAHLMAQGGYFLQLQNGGTPDTQSEAEAGYIGLRAQAALNDESQLDARAYARFTRFLQSRSRIAPERVSESLAANQDIPSDEEGLALLWTSRLLGAVGDGKSSGTHQISTGADARRVFGVANETLYPASPSAAALTLRRSSGEQQFGGVFIEDLYSPVRPIEISAALRLDGFRNLLGSRIERSEDGTLNTFSFPERTFSQLDPRIAARWHALPWLTWRGSVYRAFRAPTLNELYRPFQVGNILTAPNDALQPESLWGGELGAETVFGAWVGRLTGFWNSLYRPVVNVSLPVPLADGSQRIRENLGRADIRGLEFSVEGRIARRWTLTAGYTWAASRVADAPQYPVLVGKQLAQDPAHRFSVSVTFDDPRIVTATLQVRYVGPQFEDDLNTQGMSGAFWVDAGISRRLVSFLDAYLTAQNLLNQRYLVGRAGVDTIGPPLMVMLGVRLRSAR